MEELFIEDFGEGFVFWDEFDAEWVHAVSRVGFGQVFASEDVAEVGAAVGALDLGPHTIRVRNFLYRSWEMIFERRPATSSVKFRLRAEQGSIAPSADIRPVFIKVIILTSERHLRAFGFDNACFVCV
jgi:hypothetical protein